MSNKIVLLLLRSGTTGIGNIDKPLNGFEALMQAFSHNAIENFDLVKFDYMIPHRLLRKVNSTLTGKESVFGLSKNNCRIVPDDFIPKKNGISTIFFVCDDEQYRELENVADELVVLSTYSLMKGWSQKDLHESLVPSEFFPPDRFLWHRDGAEDYFRSEELLCRCDYFQVRELSTKTALRRTVGV